MSAIAGQTKAAPAWLERWSGSFVVSWFRRYGLAAWFAILSGVWLYEISQQPTPLAYDQYIVATQRWLAGGNPWATMDFGWFAAPPITLLPLVPFAILPFGGQLLVGLSIASGIATIRILRLPWFWIMFPPLIVSMVGGGIDAWIIPLILGTRLGWVGVLGKAYAAVPLALLGRWKPLVIAGIVTLGTAPFLPWPAYIAQFPTIQRHLVEQAENLSAPLVLMPVAIAALILMGRRRAAWMAIPALWPSTQWYYNTISLPALTPLAAALMAYPSQWTVLGSCVVLAIQQRATSGQGLRDGWRMAGAGSVSATSAKP